jgi:anaerobic magnesium-protoporphyrin IX monomethyl ester cyclase
VEDLQSLLSPTNVDFFVVNAQGETALVNIINALKQNLSFETIDNIYYRDGKEYKGTKFYLENNLLQENTIDWNLFKARNESYAAIRTATSCPYSCSFCSYTKLAGKYQTVSIACIEKELDALHNIGKVKMINFIDDTFNIPPDRFKAILKMMIKKRYQFKWGSFFRCQYADREMVELMKESGCIGAFLGIESANDVVLKNMNKAVTVEQYRNGMKLLNEYEILSLASILIGFPGETPETVRETVEFIEEFHPFGYHVNLWYCNPFAPIWEQRDRFGIKGGGQQWSHQTMDSMQACDHFEAMVLNIKNSLWMPYFDFDFMCIGYLMAKGLKLEKLKNFIGGFDEGIKEKIKEPDKVEISPEIYQKMAAAFEG